MKNYASLTRREVKGLFKVKRLAIAAISTVLTFYAIQYFLPFLKTENHIITLAMAGIVALIITEALD